MEQQAIRVATAAISNRIFAGRVSKDGTCFVGEKHDVTLDVIKAIVDHVEAGHEITVRENGKPKFIIQVRRLCDKCGKSKKLHPYDEEQLCGTCISRYERRINTREMHGKGRQGY